MERSLFKPNGDADHRANFSAHICTNTQSNRSANATANT
jgi:hypothetical protein